MNLGWCPIVQALMQSLVVVELEISVQAGFQIGNRCIVLKVNVLILDRPPKPFDEHIVQGAASAIHAHPNVGGFETGGELLGGELIILISVKDVRPAQEQRLLESFQTEPAIERVG